MLGDKYARGPEDRGVHGAILENIKAIGNDILATLSIFSRSLKSLIDAGKRGLSLGYNCRFEKAIGEYNGMRYDYIQRDIRGNHLALVTQGRNGTVVLDSAVMDEFDLNIKEMAKMAEENKKNMEKKEGEAKEMNLSDVHAYLKEHAPMWKELQNMMSKEEGGEEADKKTALDGDTKEKEGDQKAEDSPESEKKAEKEEEKAEDDKKEDAMDSAAITTLIESKIADFKNGAIKTLSSGIAARDALAKKLVPHIGTFACDTMDASEVAEYGAKKLGITGGVEAVNAYLAAADKFKNNATFAMDSTLNSKAKEGGKLSTTLSKAS